MAILSGKNSNFNCFIESINDAWYIGIGFPEKQLVHNDTDKYNNMTATKYWTQTDLKYAKTIALTTYLSKLDKTKLLS